MYSCKDVEADEEMEVPKIALQVVSDSWWFDEKELKKNIKNSGTLGYSPIGIDASTFHMNIR